MAIQNDGEHSLSLPLLGSDGQVYLVPREIAEKHRLNVDDHLQLDELLRRLLESSTPEQMARYQALLAHYEGEVEGHALDLQASLFAAVLSMAAGSLAPRAVRAENPPTTHVVEGTHSQSDRSAHAPPSHLPGPARDVGRLIVDLLNNAHARVVPGGASVSVSAHDAAAHLSVKMLTRDPPRSPDVSISSRMDSDEIDEDDPGEVRGVDAGTRIGLAALPNVHATVTTDVSQVIVTDDLVHF